jgi:hypothetical protein
MTIANDIIAGRTPDIDAYLRTGDTLDDIDEYGFTPLIECAIARQPSIAKLLLARGADVNTPDTTGRTALHWAVDHYDMDMVRLLLEHEANANAYTLTGLSVLVYPVLRGQNPLKQILFQYGAKLDFALDFIYAKLLGHRFELHGDVDIVNVEGEFIEVDYEGFVLEFTVASIKDSLLRFTSSYSTKHLRAHFPQLHLIMDAFTVADELLQYQHHTSLSPHHQARIAELMHSPLLFLPAASRGHALSFICYQNWWAKIDRGENSLKEGSVNIYEITKRRAFTKEFLQEFLYKKQPRRYFHEIINKKLGLVPVATLPLTSQISGNCSWSNVQAVVLVAYVMLQRASGDQFSFPQINALYEDWLTWDKDRALDESIQRFYLADPVRRASLASMLGAILFQACDDNNDQDLKRAEKIIPILTLPEHYYILQSYLDVFCVKTLTRKGNNLLKLLDDCGINPNIGISPIATGLHKRK